MSAPMTLSDEQMLKLVDDVEAARIAAISPGSSGGEGYHIGLSALAAAERDRVYYEYRPWRELLHERITDNIRRDAGEGEHGA